MKKKILINIITLAVIAGMLTGCTSEATSISNAEGVGEVNVNTSYYYLPVGTYDSADTAILKSIDADTGTVTLYNTVADKSYTLNYDGTTYALDKYGTTMSMAQLKEGMIVNVNFYKATKQLVDIQISPDAWSYENVKKYNLGGMNQTATIGDRTYALTKGLKVFSQGKQTDLMNIIEGDTLTVSGIGNDIYSITVEGGHGYIRLTNDDALVGGWVEVGSELICRVTEPGMLLTVPEGAYTVRMYNDTSSVVQDITVDRNQEVVLDCRNITIPVVTYGRILFNLSPEEASLKLDGEYRDTSEPVKTDFGIHQIEVSAAGYDTISRYVNVGEEMAVISISLDKTEAYVSANTSVNTPQTTTPTEQNNTAAKTDNTNNNANKSTVSSNTVSGNTVSGNTVSGNTQSSNSSSKGNKVYLSYPQGVEVYVDGIYQGVTPLNFKKVEGSHTIVLKKTGYATKSYTVYMYNDGEDVSISFADLDSVQITQEELETLKEQLREEIRAEIQNEKQNASN